VAEKNSKLAKIRQLAKARILGSLATKRLGRR